MTTNEKIEQKVERARLIKELTKFVMKHEDDSWEVIEECANFILLDRARIVAPLDKLGDPINRLHQNHIEDINKAIDETLRNAGVL